MGWICDSKIEYQIGTLNQKSKSCKGFSGMNWERPTKRQLLHPQPIHVQLPTSVMTPEGNAVRERLHSTVGDMSKENPPTNVAQAPTKLLTLHSPQHT